MARRRKRPRVAPGELERILAGESRPTLERLLELVRAVNPTRITSADGEQRARGYALKARLQDLIIAWHAGELAVHPTRHPGVVALRLVGRRGDACHAVVAELAPESRAWVAAALQARAPAGARGESG